MFRFLSIASLLFFITVAFTANAQIPFGGSRNAHADLAAQNKKGALSIRTSSGMGADQCSLGTLSASQKYICLNNSTPITITESSAGGGFHFLNPTLVWYHNGENLSSDINLATITVTQAGIYRVVETNGSSDSCWDEILITSTLPVIIPIDNIVCSDSSITLQAPAANATINNFQWYNGSTPLSSGPAISSYTATQTGNYYVQTTDANGCIQNSDVVNIDIETPPSSLSIVGSTCTNDTLSVTDNSNLVPDSITWFRDNVPIKSFSNTGITVAGGNGVGNNPDQLNKPYGIFLDADKNIYIADYGNDRIVKYIAGTNSGEVIADSISNIYGVNPNDVFLDGHQNLAITTTRGIIVTPPLPFQITHVIRKDIGSPTPTIVADNNSNFYAYNGSTQAIERWNPYTGNDSIFYQNSQYTATNIFIDTLNNFFYISAMDEFNNDAATVIKWMPGNSSGDVEVVANANADGSIGWPGQLTVDHAGNIYVEDTLNQNVQIWTDPETQIILANGFRPKGMKLDNDGNLFVADASNNQVLEFFSSDIASLITTSTPITGTVVAGGNGNGAALNQLSSIEGIFIDANKNIFIADNANDRIVEWPAGAVSGQPVLNNISSFSGFKNNLVDVWIDNNNNLFFSDSGNIMHVPVPFPDTLKLKVANAWSVTGDASSNLYIAKNGGIEKWNPYTNTDSLFGSGTINEPNGIYKDALNNIYVGDNLTDSEYNYYGRIVKFAPAGTGTVTLGSNYSQIGATGGIAVDTAGNTFIADINNNRVLAWKKGSPTPVTIASGYTPWGIKLDSDGNIYVSDQTNNRVVMYPPMIKNYIIDTFAGVYKAQVSYPGSCTVTTSPITITNCTLPLQLLNFTGQLQKSDVLLTWQTAQELNTDYFNIERSLDGIHFTSIGNIPANNNSAHINNYDYTDIGAAGISTDKLYYRLQEFDKDGAFTYSKIIIIAEPGHNITISPNPVHDLLTVNLKNITGAVHVGLFNLNGQQLMEQNIIGSGNKTILFNIAGLAAGNYFIQITNNGKIDQEKFIKM
ncbi:MAG TPA: T9SS type A sorting domain-containing protein [Ginsengibacter sp.]